MTAPHPAHRPIPPAPSGRAGRGWRRWRTALAAAMSAALAAGLTLAAPAAAPAAGPNAADPGPTRAEVVVEDEVRLELAGGGETDFWVYLSDEPELGPASGIADRGPRSVAPQVRASDVHGVAVDGG